jgi:hypothetical protein
MIKTILYMKCNKEQFDEIKCILEKNNIELGAVVHFNRYKYLYINKNDEYNSLFVSNTDIDVFNRISVPVYEKWDENVFLKACGIKSLNSTLIDKLL